jgi:VCBS repeat-containing protein
VELFAFADRALTADQVVAAPPVAADDAGALGEDADGSTAARPRASSRTISSRDRHGAAVAGGSVGAAVAGTWGTLTLRDDGSYAYELSAAAQALGEGEVETDTFAYTLSDGRGGTDAGSLAIAVTGRNDRAVLGADSLSGTEDAPLVTDAAALLGNDRDPDRGDVLSLVTVGGAVRGTVALDAQGRIVFTADPDYDGPASFT